MDFMGIFTLIWPFLIEWWPFFAVAVILYIVGNQIKKYAPSAKTSKFWMVYWATLPIHPLVVGIILGFFGLPVPATVQALGEGAAELYYGFAGILSPYLHDVIQTAKKYIKKHFEKEE